MLISSSDVLKWIDERQEFLSKMCFSKRHLRELDLFRQYIEKLENKPPLVEIKETNIFDCEEIIENCTVQVLTNSVTGEVSVGWWKNG